jgi:hypothetical protein
MNRPALLIAILLLTTPAYAQTVHDSSVGPSHTTTVERIYRGAEDGDGVTRALRRHLRRQLVDAGLRRAGELFGNLGSGLGTGWPSSPHSDSTTGGVAPRRYPIAYRLQPRPFELCVGVDLVHRRGWEASLEVDLDDRTLTLELEPGHRLTYGIAYQQEDGTVEATLRLPF